MRGQGDDACRYACDEADGQRNGYEASMCNYAHCRGSFHVPKLLLHVSNPVGSGSGLYYISVSLRISGNDGFVRRNWGRIARDWRRTSLAIEIGSRRPRIRWGGLTVCLSRRLGRGRPERSPSTSEAVGARGSCYGEIRPGGRVGGQPAQRTYRPTAPPERLPNGSILCPR
jgi:hypothetical protein